MHNTRTSKPSTHVIGRLARLAACSAALVAGAAVLTVSPAPAAGQITLREDPQSIASKQQTAARMMRRIEEVDLQDQRLEDIVRFIRSVTQADIEPIWRDTAGGIGLDREQTVTLAARDVTALTFLEMVLEKVNRDAAFGESATWQFTRYGTLEFGPREALNRRQRLEVYDVNDLLFQVPDYDEAPEFDLDSIFSQGGEGGGGGGQSPFQTQDQDPERLTEEELIERLMDILRTFVETEQWQVNGGQGGTMEEYRGTLMIRAADYIHRQLAGYTWWPSVAQTTTVQDGRQTTTLRDAGIDFEPWEENPPARRRAVSRP